MPISESHPAPTASAPAAARRLLGPALDCRLNSPELLGLVGVFRGLARSGSRKRRDRRGLGLRQLLTRKCHERHPARWKRDVRALFRDGGAGAPASPRRRCRCGRDRLDLAGPHPTSTSRSTSTGPLALLVGNLGHRQVLVVAPDAAAGSRRAPLAPRAPG